MQNLEENLRMFEWGGMSSEALEGLSMIAQYHMRGTCFDSLT